MRARHVVALAVAAVALSGCTYGDLLFVKVVGQGCSSVSAGQAANDASGEATGTAAGGGGGFVSRLERAFASDDRCPASEEDEPEGEAPPGGEQ